MQARSIVHDESFPLGVCRLILVVISAVVAARSSADVVVVIIAVRNSLLFSQSIAGPAYVSPPLLISIVRALYTSFQQTSVLFVNLGSTSLRAPMRAFPMGG